MNIVPVKCWFSLTDSEIIYSLKNGDEWDIDQRGSVFFTESADYGGYTPTMGIPHDPNAHKNLSIMEYKGKFGVYDANMQMIAEYDNVENVVDDVQHEETCPFREKDFACFDFPPLPDYEPDCEGNADWHGGAPSFYHAGYDGPYHYTPPGEH